MQLRWDEDLDAWVGDAPAPGSKHDPAVGPPGPAGVVATRTASASVSRCTMTGRVTTLWFEQEVDDEAAAMLGDVLADGPPRRLPALDGSGRAAPIELAVRPVADQLAAVRLALLDDIRDQTKLPAGGMAELLFHAERAAVLHHLVSRQPASRRARAAEAALTRAQDLARRSTDELLEGVAERSGPQTTTDRLDALVEELGPLGADAARLRARINDLRHALRRPPMLGAPAPAEPVFRGPVRGLPATVEPQGPIRGLPAPDAAAPTDPVRFELHQTDDPARTGATIAAVIDPNGSVTLGELAAKRFGIAAGAGHVDAEPGWASVRLPIERGRQLVDQWVTLHAAGQPVGSAPLGVRDGEAIAAVMVSSAPDALVIGPSPLGEVRSPAVTDLDRLSRAAWWARRCGDGRSGGWFAQAAVGWLAAGLVLRAGWAATLADQRLLDRLLAESVADGYVAAARAALSAAEVEVPPPDLADSIPLPALWLAVDLGSDLPAAWH